MPVITYYDGIAVLPKRCDICNRLFWLEPYNIFYKTVGVESRSLKQIECKNCENSKLIHKSKLKCSSCENYNTCTYKACDTYSSLGCSNYIRQGSNPPISEAVKNIKHSASTSVEADTESE